MGAGRPGRPEAPRRCSHALRASSPLVESQGITPMATAWRARVHALLHETETRSPARSAVTAVLVVVIVISLSAVILETLDWLAAAIGPLFAVVEAVAVTVLSAEYLLRLWAAPEGDAPGVDHPWRAR